MNEQENERSELFGLINQITLEIERRYPSDNLGKRVLECENVARDVKELLDGYGIKNKVLEGTIKISEKDYLEHFANLIYTNTGIILIDLTSKQIPILEHEDWIVKEFISQDLLKEYLKTTYNWVTKS